MKKINLFLTLFVLLCATTVMFQFQGCSLDDLNPTEPGPINNTFKAVANINGTDVVVNGRAIIPSDRQVAFDASRSIGTITKYLWTGIHYGSPTSNFTDSNKTFLKMFTAVPDSFAVTLKVWGQLQSDTSSVSFTLIVQNTGVGITEPYLESSIILTNGKRVDTYVLPKSLLPGGPYNQPTLYGDQHGLIWQGKTIPLDTLNTNGGFRWRDTSYTNGGFAMNYSGAPSSPWALASGSIYKKPGNENLFWFDPRGGALYGWGQPALVAPGSVGDTSYLNGVMRNSFTSSAVNLFINERTGNAGPTTTPTYQYSSSITNWTTANLNMTGNSSGWGPGSVNFTSIGSDNILKIRPGNNVVIVNSIYYVPSEAALILVVIQPMRLILPLAQARALGYSNDAINALLAANPSLR